MLHEYLGVVGKLSHFHFPYILNLTTQNKQLCISHFITLFGISTNDIWLTGFSQQFNFNVITFFIHDIGNIHCISNSKANLKHSLDNI